MPTLKRFSRVPPVLDQLPNPGWRERQERRLDPRLAGRATAFATANQSDDAALPAPFTPRGLLATDALQRIG